MSVGPGVLRSGFFGRRGIIYLIWIGIITSLTAACFLQKMAADNDRLTTDARFVGRISTPFKSANQVRVILWRESLETIEVEALAHPNTSGIFAFLIRDAAKVRRLWVHEDVNGNGQYDSDEPTWLNDTEEPLPISRGIDTPTLELALSTEAVDAALYREIENALKNEKDQTRNTTQVPIGFGEVVDFDDPRLASNTGVAGLWLPSKTVAQSGLGIYFLKPYDPALIPVVLVHGAGGSPQDFRTLVSTFPDGPWQFWVYTYPSGIRLQSAADAMASILIGLHNSHKTKPIMVVAHSMGGLVARAAVERIEDRDKRDIAGALITVSTPWNGHPAARYGVKRSPFSIPSWHDMLPTSDFVESTANGELRVDHLLIYGEKSRQKFFLPTRNDGTIGIESAMFAPVFDKAVATLRYELGHGEIIRSPAVIGQIAKFIQSRER